jgi:hypothetical protein
MRGSPAVFVATVTEQEPLCFRAFNCLTDGSAGSVR